MDKGLAGMLYFLHHLLRPALTELRVDVQQQVAEGNLVSTRKLIRGIHTGNLLGVTATNKKVEIEVMDIVRVEAGKYVEHWAVNNLPSVLNELAKK